MGRLAEKLAFRVVNPALDKPYIVMTAVICATVCIMCPAMSFFATILYDGITVEFLAQWMQKIVYNFPFALCTQIFFIQPFVRFLFRAIFGRRLKIQTHENMNESAGI